MKKIDRKTLASMSTREALAAARAPYARLLGYLKPYRGRFLAGIFFGVLAGLSNGLLVPVTQIVANRVLQSANHSDGPKTKPLPGLEGLSGWRKKAESFAPGGAKPAPAPVATEEKKEEPADWKKVALLIGLLPLVMLMRGLFGYINSYCMQWVSMKVLDDIRLETFQKILGQSQEFFNKQKTGDLIQTAYNQTRTAQMALTQIASDMVKQPFALISPILCMLFIDWPFTLLSFTLFPLILLPVLAIGKKIRNESNKEEEELGQVMTIMHEALSGVRVVKGYNREEYETQRFAKANRLALLLALKWRRAMEITGPMVETVAAFGIAGALFYAWKHAFTPGDFIALCGALVLMYEPAKTLSKLHLLMQKCLIATTKIFELMDRPSAVQDAPEAVPLTQPVQGQISFHEVSFGYQKKDRALNGVTLHIPAGSTCALVGPSGAGKSSMAALLLRFYDPKKGYITVDGQDIRRVTQASLREAIGLVNQETFLFHDTIYENIRYGRLDATKEEIEEAAQRAFAHDFILAQPQGYETIVGDKGRNLSGGQQQRLCLARAFLRQAPILILDEAYSALDTESEAKIQAALEDLAKNKTVIAIAHRLSTILKADQIVVMENGEIRATGTHRELLEKDELYQRLCQLQFAAAS
jgi:ATP-binding cassette, subfamily B, bacterial MsbA